MKKAIVFGTFIGLLLSPLSGENVYKKIAEHLIGPTVQHKYTGLVDVDEYKGTFSGISGSQNQVVSARIPWASPKVYLDQSDDKNQYVSWKSNNLQSWELEWHLTNDSMGQRIGLNITEGHAKSWLENDNNILIAWGLLISYLIGILTGLVFRWGTKIEKI